MAEKKTEDVKDEEAEDTGLSTADTYVQIFLIQVEVSKATNLVKADVFGLSDPYCRVTALRQTYTTKTIMKTLDPVWDEKTQFIFFKDPKELSFHVWDWDRGTKHDAIGDYTVSLNGFFENNHPGFSGPVTLKNVKKGELHVKIKCRKLLPIDLEIKATNLQNLEKEQINTIAELEAQIESLTNENAASAQANRLLEEQIGNLTKSNKDLRDKASQLDSQRQSLEEQKTKLSQIQASVQKEYGDISNQFVFLQSALEEERDVVNDLASENEGLKTEQKKTVHELDDASSQIAKLEKEIEQLKQKKEQEKNKPKQAPVKTDNPREEEIKPTSPLIEQKEAPPANNRTGCCSIL